MFPKTDLAPAATLNRGVSLFLSPACQGLIAVEPYCADYRAGIQRTKLRWLLVVLPWVSLQRSVNRTGMEDSPHREL